jgi:hypothetical protein
MAVMGARTANSGRPSLRTPQLEAEILDRLANCEGLYQPAGSPHMPERQTILRWAREDEDFRYRYMRAMEAGSDAQGDDCGKIAREETDVKSRAIDNRYREVAGWSHSATTMGRL